MTQKVIIVTGASGFIGSCLVQHLNTLGYERLLLVDYLGHSEKWKNLVGKKFIDFIAPQALFGWIQGKETEIQAIFHLGACSNTTETDGDFLLENNYRYSKTVAEFAIKNQIRFIYASSAATYGDGALGFSDDHALLEQLQPLNLYGYSKHLFDLWLKRENLLDKVVGLKYFNIFGPNEYHKGRMASVLVKMVPDALKSHTISLFKSNHPHYTDGGQCRDFLYVKEAVRMTCSFLTNSLSGIYNIGSGIACPWNTLAQAVIVALKKPEVKVQYMDMPQDISQKYQNYTCAEMGKFKSCVELTPLFSLESAVEDYVQNYLVSGNYL